MTNEADQREVIALERFPDDVTDVQSRIVIVHQLRASADIQDQATKRETGWADTSDRATLMRKAADTIERLALAPRPDAVGEAPEQLEERMVRAAYDDWPTRAISPALAEMFDLPLNAVIPMERLIEKGGDVNGLRRTVRAVLAALSADAILPGEQQ